MFLAYFMALFLVIMLCDFDLNLSFFSVLGCLNSCTSWESFNIHFNSFGSPPKLTQTKPHNPCIQEHDYCRMGRMTT
jgi:hypothetical protein